MCKAHAETFFRSRLLLGEAGLERLRQSHVVLCGVGGVGSYIAEALVRSGLGKITLVDFDQVAPSNINRQLCALQSTVGQDKVDVVAARLRDVNPECEIKTEKTFVDPETVAQVITGADYVADAIDYLPGKVALVLAAREQNIPLICALGAGRRFDPTLLRVADIRETRICPLARNFRRELRLHGIESGVEVVFSLEQPQTPPPTQPGQKPEIGSLSFVPGAMGLTMASLMVRRLSGLGAPENQSE